ncbi:MAG: hypothetical protein ACKOUS_06525 [Alphaproteobacteria bacterium]
MRALDAVLEALVAPIARRCAGIARARARVEHLLLEPDIPAGAFGHGQEPSRRLRRRPGMPGDLVRRKPGDRKPATSGEGSRERL